ncbi:secretion/conjugation apparatus DotM-related subunit [Serratia fonticola]
MKKIYKVTWYAANVLLPLSETARILRTMKYSGSKLAEQARRLKQEKQTASNEILSFDEAIRISGMSHETLIRRYLSTKRIWLMLFGVAVIFIVLLPFATLMVEGPVSGNAFEQFNDHERAMFTIFGLQHFLDKRSEAEQLLDVLNRSTLKSDRRYPIAIC